MLPESNKDIIRRLEILQLNKALNEDDLEALGIAIVVMKRVYTFVENINSGFEANYWTNQTIQKLINKSNDH